MKNAMTSVTRFNLVAVILSGFLAACANQQAATVECPEVRIPLNTERVTRFAPGEGRDITDVEVRAEIGFLSGECTVHDERVEMVFPIAVRGTKGPADTDNVEALSAFLAVSDRDRNVLSRRQLPFTLQFAGNETKVVNTDVITVTIPKTEEQSAKEFVVFLGFNLSREEYAFNREESGS